MVVLLSGKQGSGKTSTASALELTLARDGFYVYRHRFAQVIYEMHDAILAILAKYGISRDIKKDGPLLQLLGTEYGRKTLGEDIWVNCVRNWCRTVMPPAFNSSDKIVIIDDLRFKNEFTAFEGQALRVRLECSKEVRMQRCEQWRDNDTHPSEVDLDDWLDKFELVLHTDTTPLADVVDHIKGAVRARILSRPGA